MPGAPLPLTGRETGIDVGLQVFLVSADGELVENPRLYRKAEKQLANAQRRVNRRKKGSKRRRRAVALSQRKHEQLQRQRRDFHHETALRLLRLLRLLRTYDTDLSRRRAGGQPGPQVRSRRLAKSISDAGWARFRAILACKAAWAGRRVAPCNPRSPARTVAAVGGGCPRA